jgi:methyl-accepting chemotaxis protein
MSTTLRSGAAQQAAQAPASNADSGFFAHHGVWAPGVRLFRTLRFTSKAVIISLAFILPLLGLLGWQLKNQTEQAMTARKDATRQHVEIAHGILVWAHAQETTGAMPREQAQQLARKAISGLRYEGAEYFWINDMQPRMVMHPIKPALDGTDLSNFKDPNGFALFQGFVATARKDGKGFVAYQWPKPGSDKPVDKVSYVASSPGAGSSGRASMWTTCGRPCCINWRGTAPSSWHRCCSPDICS